MPSVEIFIEAALAYGLYDRVVDFTGPPMEVVQTDASAPMEFDGWKAEKRISIDDLQGYIESQWLD